MTNRESQGPLAAIAPDGRTCHKSGFIAALLSQPTGVARRPALAVHALALRNDGTSGRRRGRHPKVTVQVEYCAPPLAGTFVQEEFLPGC
jgi:hypothetical protein